MACVVACANTKGGVGKTTVAIALAEATAHIGHASTLVIDLDPQINASITLAGATPANQLPWRQENQTIVSYLSMLRDGNDPNPNILARQVRKLGDCSISYISGDPTITRFERQTLARPNQTVHAASGWFLSAVDRMLDQLRPNYGLIVIDCPPGLSLLCEAVLHRADRIVVPVSPTPLATQGLQAYIQYLGDEVGVVNLQQKSAILKNMVSNDQVSREFVELINQLQVADHYFVLNNEWGQRVAFRRAMDRRQDTAPFFNRLMWHTWFGQTYGGQADTVITTTQELWALLTPGEGQ